MIIDNHYTGTVPSGKSWYYVYDCAIIVFSIPANKNASRWLLGEDNAVVELSRLWAPDGHVPNLLTQAISEAIAALRSAWGTDIKGIISYADPNAGHAGGVYRAASWVYLGQGEDGRNWRDSEGNVMPRRKFHSGSTFLRKPEIEALGFQQVLLPGKHRFARGLTRQARRRISLMADGIS